MVKVKAEFNILKVDAPIKYDEKGINVAFAVSWDGIKGSARLKTGFGFFSPVATEVTFVDGGEIWKSDGPTYLSLGD